MNGETPEMEPPDDATILASVHRVESRVIAGIRVDRKRRRRIRVGLSVLVGGGLFAGGMFVGAAAVPPAANPGANPGVTTNSRGQTLPNQFAIDCYTSRSDTQPSEMDDTGPAPGAPTNLPSQADERNPAAVCEAMQRSGDITEALLTEAKTLAAHGIDHGFIQITGDHVYNFERGFGPNGTRVGWALDDGSETTAEGITIAATIPLPARPTTATAVCAAASNWVKVYPRGAMSATTLCASLGLSVWDSEN